MLAYNHIVIIGNLTRNPEIKTVGNAGKKLARLSVCINDKRKMADGKVFDNHVFVDVEAWARLAELCEKYLSKNSVVFVEGRLQMAQWEKDGVKHQKLKIQAQNIKFLPRGNAMNKANKKNNGGKKEDNVPDSDVFVPDETQDVGQDNDFENAMSEW